MSAPIDITGHRYGRLVAIRYVKPAQWLCRCDCGNETIVQQPNLRNGVSKSCGCLRKELARERALKHGHTNWRGPKSPTYQCWQGMMRRCTNPKMQNWRYYGGRGIRVCERWHDFANFLANMGEKPAGLSIDRIDVNGNYEPSNCRWTTAKEQARDKVRGPDGKFT